MNNALPPGPGRPEDADLLELFDIVWPKLEAQLSSIHMEDRIPHRDQRELIEETLELVRDLARANDGFVFTNATMSASGPGYIPLPDNETPPSNRVMNQLVRTAGPEGTVTISGVVPNRVVTVQSPRFRKDSVDADRVDRRFLREMRDILRPYGVQLVLHDGGKVCEPEWAKPVG
jgi:hypothetical protein